MAEAILRQWGDSRFNAYSAGSRPAGSVNPFALELLQEKSMPIDSLRSKSWNEFAHAGAPQMDIILTVCDNAAGETCPVWPGHPVTAHWGIPDPAAVEGTTQQKRQAFADAFDRLAALIRQLLALPDYRFERGALQNDLRSIAQS